MGHLDLVDLRRHAARTVLTAVGIAIGVATIVALLALSAGIERSAAGLINLGGAELGMFQGGVGELTASSLPTVARRRASAASRACADATPIAVATGELRGARRRSWSSASSRPASSAAASCSSPAARRRGATRPSSATRRRASSALGVGERLPLAAAASASSASTTRACRSRTRAPRCALDAVERMRGRPGDATTIAVKSRAGRARRSVGDRLGRAFPGTVAISQPGQVARVDTNSLLIRKAAVVFVALALIIGGIAVMNTMLMAVFERRREFALLLAVGWPRRLVAGWCCARASLLSLAGALAGVVLGVAAGELIVRAFGASALVSPHVHGVDARARRPRRGRDRDARQPLPGLVGHAPAAGRGARVNDAAATAVAQLADAVDARDGASGSWLTSSTVMPRWREQLRQQLQDLRRWRPSPARRSARRRAAAAGGRRARGRARRAGARRPRAARAGA